MWKKIRVVFTIPELRKKILFTLALLAVYRVGWQIPLPVVDQGKMGEFFRAQAEGGLGVLFEQVAVFSASQLSQATIFGLGIMPYISASIIFQLLASVYKPLEELQKERGGQKKINEYTRYATVVICLGQSWFYVGFLIRNGLVYDDFLTPAGGLSFGWQLTAVMTMTAGTVFLMWLGEQIDEYGIGNGISLLIMAGILARMPGAGYELLKPMIDHGVQLGAGRGQVGVETLLVLAVMFVGVVFGVVFITQGQRRIPITTGKQVRGRRLVSTSPPYLPLRVNQAGVMPIIFASSLLLFPSVLFGWLAQAYGAAHTWLNDLQHAFQRGDSFLYNLLYVALIYFFCYFWTAITINPKTIGDNVRQQGAHFRGFRPHRIPGLVEKVMNRITYVGAGFLALVAIIPTIIAGAMGIPYSVAAFYGGTGLLIAVSVAFDLVQKIDNHLVMMPGYKGKGLLDKW